MCRRSRRVVCSYGQSVNTFSVKMLRPHYDKTFGLTFANLRRGWYSLWASKTEPGDGGPTPASKNCLRIDEGSVQTMRFSDPSKDKHHWTAVPTVLECARAPPRCVGTSGFGRRRRMEYAQDKTPRGTIRPQRTSFPHCRRQSKSTICAERRWFSFIVNARTPFAMATTELLFHRRALPDGAILQ